MGVGAFHEVGGSRSYQSLCRVGVWRDAGREEVPVDQGTTYCTQRAPRKASDIVLYLSLVVSAFLIALGHSSPDHAWLGWVALLPLFQSIRVFSPAKAMLVGASWGLCLFLALLIVATTANIATFGSFALLVTVPALYGFLATRVTRQIGFSPLLLGLGWIGLEFALLPIGLRNGLLAGTQGNGAIISWVGAFAGTVVVAFVVAYVNAALFATLSRVVSSACGRIVASGPVPGPRPIFPSESLRLLSLIVLPGQPRAPPARYAPCFVD